MRPVFPAGAAAGLLLAFVAASVCAQTQPRAVGPDSEVALIGELAAPRVAPPCRPGACRFAGQRVTALVTSGSTIVLPLREVKAEFESATGATLEIVQKPLDEHFAAFVADASSRGGRYDVSMAGAWWLGELVEAGFVLPYDRWYSDRRFPQWDFDEVLPAPRGLLTYSAKRYMVANDHDGQVMYYRRDLFADPAHQAAFNERFGYPLAVPKTWSQFRDIAAYFDGKDLNGDGVPDNGLTLGLKVGGQAMFHFMSFSAPYVIGPKNRHLYWFDAATMEPLIEGVGHVRALQAFVDLVRFGPRDMLGWDLEQSWSYFLEGRAALSFSWGDLGALAQEAKSRVKGKVGVSPLPGTSEYCSPKPGACYTTPGPNVVGNTIGGSWAGVISRHSKAPEAAYYLLALMAMKQKALVYAARGWDGVDPGRKSQFLPPQGTASLDHYLKYGWDAADVRDYLSAYAETFGNSLQMPYLRIPGAFSYWQALDAHLADATSGRVDAAVALRAAAVDFEEITLRIGREKQRRSYRASLGL